MFALLLSLCLAAAEPLPAAPPAAAPELAVSAWISRGPPQAEDAHPILVVEVWATWCGPCHETFPLLTDLQKQWGDRIRVVALTDDRPDRVRRFFHDNREQMRFAIAVDESSASVQALMFGGFGGRGLPSVYVIDAGQMLWSGQPEDLAAALAALPQLQETAEAAP